MMKTITLDLREEGADETRARIVSMIAGMDLPEGMSFGQGAAGNDNQDLKDLGIALLLSIFFNYLLMGFLFESFALPLSIVFTIPLAVMGVGWIHFFTGKDMDSLGVVGTILLVGVVVNNGIVLIDYTIRLREQGHTRREALLIAADHRFRPILMTALTTVIGMFPLAVSKPTDAGISYKSFGLTLIGGMSTGTILTLLVIPVLYTTFDDARIAMGRFTRRFTTRKTEGSPELAMELKA